MARKPKKEREKKERNLNLPLFSRKKKGAEEPQDSGFQVGGGKSAESKTSSPFGGSFSIKEDISPLPSDKEAKRNRKGKSSISLGAKFGGQRKMWALLVLLLVLSLLAGLLSLTMLSGKMGRGEAKDQISEQIKNETDSGFPAGDAGMWVESFVRTYGTWDYKTPEARAADLSPYLAPGMDAQAGWDGEGEQKVIYSTVSSDPEIIDSNRAIYSAMYQIEDGTWRCSAIPVYAYRSTDASQAPEGAWGFAVTANPTPTPCSLRVSVPAFEEADFNNVDDEASETLRSSFFPGFFSAWFASDADTLRQYMAPDVTTFGLGGIYEGEPQINEVILPIDAEEDAAATDTIYSAYVSLTAKDRNGASQTVTYKVPVSSNGSQWQVQGEPEPVVQELGGQGGGLEESVAQPSQTEDGAQMQENEYAQPESESAGSDGEREAQEAESSDSSSEESSDSDD